MILISLRKYQRNIGQRVMKIYYIFFCLPLVMVRMVRLWSVVQFLNLFLKFKCNSVSESDDDLLKQR